MEARLGSRIPKSTKPKELRAGLAAERVLLRAAVIGLIWLAYVVSSQLTLPH